jgi:5-methylcytosine-specific restriction enzyme A
MKLERMFSPLFAARVRGGNFGPNTCVFIGSVFGSFLSGGSLMAALQNRPWREWYNDAQYRARRKQQLQKQPMCEECLAQGRTPPATIADHVEPHKGDIRKFRTGRLRSLCKPCHDLKWGDDRRGFSTAVGVDGMPLDERHQTYQQDRKYSTTSSS